MISRLRAGIVYDAYISAMITMASRTATDHQDKVATLFMRALLLQGSVATPSPGGRQSTA
jgi:hypothetical protein